MAESALRQYEYGGEGLFGAFMPSRREIISPEAQIPMGYRQGRRGPEVILENIPAQYGEPETGFEYTPIVRGAKSALNAIQGFFSEPDTAVEAGQSALQGVNQYMRDQYTAGALGGTTYNPQTGQVTEFNPVDAATMLAPSGFLTRAAATPGSTVLGMIGSKNTKYTPEQLEAIKQLDARGWDTDQLFLHGTSGNYEDAFKASSVGDLGPGFYTTGAVFDDAGNINSVMSRSGEMELVPDIARRYANIRRFMRPEQRGTGAPNTRPLIYKKDLNFLDIEGGMVGPVDAERVNALKAQGYDGIRVIDPNTGNVAQTNVFDPENVRSAFDYSIPDTPAQGQSALRTITGSQQIDAMAKNLNVPMIDRMLQPTGPVNRDMSLLERVGDVDRVNSMVVDELPGTLQPIPMVRAEDILNRPYVSTIVDTSDSSLGRIQAVNGIPVNDAVQYGGVYYGFQPENMDAGAIFANETVGATTTMLNKAKKAKDLPGAVGEPIFVPGGMMGKSIDYATMVPTLQIPYTSAVLSKKNKDLLDARIKRGKKNKKGEYVGGVPNWPGIDSPEALPFIGTIGGQRKNISTAIDEFASDGAMSLSEARAIVTDPSQFTPLAGDLRAAYEIDMSRNPAVTKRHPAYGVDIYGRPLGAFGEGFNIFSMNPLYKEGVNFLDSQRAMGRTITPTYTKEVNPKTILGGLYGTFDQETVDAMVKSGFVAP